jgi:hypothetical protein
MMDFNKFRNSAVQRFLKGNPDELTQQILKNDLNQIEREFLVKLVQNNIPNGPRGPKPKSKKPITAALIRFWYVEVDGWAEGDVLINEIERILRVSATMARKYLKQIDSPKGDAQFANSYAVTVEIFHRRIALSSEETVLVKLYREDDLKRIS